MRLGGWPPVGPWDLFPRLCQNSLPFFCGEEHPQQLLTVVPDGVVTRVLGASLRKEGFGSSNCHQKGTRPETMPAHTQTRRAEDKHTDRQTSADNTALGFWPTESSCLPVHGSPYQMASTSHQTRDQERNSPSRRADCLPARSLASVLHRLERPIRSQPSIESFLLHQIPSCFTAGPRIYTGLSCPARAPVLLSILPLCPGSVLFPRSVDPGRAPKCYAHCPNP